MKVKNVKNEKRALPVKEEIHSQEASIDADDGSSAFEGSDEESQDHHTEEDSDQEPTEAGAFVKKRPLGDDNSEPDKRKKLKKNHDLYKAPTAEELSQLRETENLFHSNLFRLQIEEILNEVKVKEKYRKHFDNWFNKLKDNIEAIPETKERELTKKKPLKKLGIEIPDFDLPVNQKGNYRFLKPSKISVIGSYPLNTVVGPQISIDIMVEMPSTLFQKHDYQDYRYLRKRAIYLSYIAANLSSELHEGKKFYGQSWMPKLKIIPSGTLAKRIIVYLHIGAEAGSFKLSRFSPERNSVRPNWLLDNSENNSELPPTPLYNANVLHDLTMAEANSRNEKMLKEYPNLRDGIILLKIWLCQRQPEKSYDSFNGHILTSYVIYLLLEKKLNTFMSSYQIIRNVWNNMMLTNWCENGITMCQEPEAKTRVIEYQKFYDCVFLDSNGYHNLTANLSANNYLWIRSEAETAVKCLDNANVDSFQVLFMRKLPFYSAFDHLICFNDTQVLQSLIENLDNEKKIDFGVNKQTQAVKIITDLLKRGLGKRVSNIYVKPDNYKEWEITEKPTEEINKIYIGFQLDPEFCFNIIEKGPPANEPEAEEFRKFWGNKSELRRFQDGLICEAVVWGKTGTISEKRMVCKQIVMFLLKSKLNISKDEYLYCGDQIDEFLKYKTTKITKFNYGTGEEATLLALQTFDSLEKELTALTDLPLPITGVQGISPVFRYTDVFPPLATVYPPDDKTNEAGKDSLLLKEKVELHNAPKSAPAIAGVIQLCASGKWPDELEAVRKTKAAFHIQIAECLRKNSKLRAKGGYKHVDIFKDGYVFRLEIAHQREIALLKQQMGDDGVIKYRDNEESIELEKKLFHLPKLNGAFHGLHSQQPSFGPTCCLVKRWLSAQMIDASHFPEIVVELLVAAMYFNPDPYKPAQVPQVGFLRFLEYFSRDSWNTDPVIVNFNDEMSREDIVAIENHFGTSRDSLPPLFISTPYDQTQSMWTIKNPTKLILNRVGSLATEVLKLIHVELFEKSIIAWKPMFRAPTNAYDVLIHIKPELISRRMQSFDLEDGETKKSWHPYKEHPNAKLPIVEFDLLEKYLNDLRTNYGEFALFFHDTYGGSIIGVLLKPTECVKKDFKVTNVSCRKLDSTGKLIFNAAAMIEDFATLGRGLIDNIDVQSKNIALN